MTEETEENRTPWYKDVFDEAQPDAQPDVQPLKVRTPVYDQLSPEQEAFQANLIPAKQVQGLTELQGVVNALIVCVLMLGLVLLGALAALYVTNR